MNLRDFRIGWRLLLQEPVYSLVVSGGLAIGFAACFLLFGYVGYCLNYDSEVPDNERVFAVKQRINVFPRPEWQTVAYLPLRDAALASGMVQDATVVRTLDVRLRVGERLHDIRPRAVDPAFQAIFGIQPLQGDLQAALTQPDGLALTLSAAQALFGASAALGRTVAAGDALLQVRALLPDPAANSTQKYKALVGIGSSAWPAQERDTAFTKWSRGTVYLKLKPKAEAAALVPLLQQRTNSSPLEQRVKTGAMGKGLNGRNVTDVDLLCLRDAYFDADLADSRDAGNHGQRSSVFGLAAVGALILLLAVINYVNLATVRTLRRQREIGIRKLLGASAARLVRQFLAESVLTTVLAALAGLLLAWLLLPVFSSLVNRRLEGIFTPPHLLAALLFALMVSLCAGAYPAWLALRALPGPALAGGGRGNSETAAGLWLRRLLTVLQFGSAIALSAAALAVGWQTYYATHAWPGFDPAGLMVLDLPEGQAAKPAARAFVDALQRLPRIDGVATMSEAAGRDGFKSVGTTRTRDGGETSIESRTVSAGFFTLYRLKPVFGRLYDPAMDGENAKAGVLLNAAGALALGYESPEAAVGQTRPDGSAIIGIAPDLRYQGLRQKSNALLYNLAPGAVVTFRSGDSVEAAYRAIEPVWRRYFPNDILAIHAEPSVLAEGYAEDARLTRILGFASVVAVCLAGFGIYVLSAYSVQRSRREIVMRKLHGAGRRDIALMLGREFSILVGAGALIGLPLAALAIERYLAGYTERAPIGYWTLAAALALAALVALLATTRHTVAALRMSPALALRD